MLVTGGIVYVGARLFAEIHVEAKALAIIAPLVLLVALRALFDPKGGQTLFRFAAGGLVALAALGSTFVALRATPVGDDSRGAALERLAEEAQGESLVFLGLDRYAAYWLRETLMRAPAGYVPEEIDNRPEKVWQQGLAVDWDNLDSRKLDKFRYAITTAAAYQSAPPSNFTEVARDGDYVLWEREGETPRSRVVEGERGDPGVATTQCLPNVVASRFETAPATGGYEEWKGVERVEDAVGGQQLGFTAPATAVNRFDLPESGEYDLSLQYHSQVPLDVSVNGEVVGEVPASLEGMYLDGAGRGSFWPVGTFDGEKGTIQVQVEATDSGPLGAERRVWLGNVAATSTSDPVEEEFRELCGYVDHYRKPRGGGDS